MSLFNIGVSAGNMIGPLLFNSNDAPYYKPGLTSTMGITCALMAIICMQTGNLFLLNKMQARKRVQNGKPAKIHDRSMEHTYTAASDGEDGVPLGENAFKDLTDSKNDEFIYVY